MKPQALFALKFAALSKKAVGLIEAPARLLWLHSQGMASSTARALVEMSLEQGGLGWKSWWNECNREKLVMALTYLQSQKPRGRIMRAALWRLTRNSGHRHPLLLPPGEQPPCAIAQDWWGLLAQWCHESGFEIRDHWVHPSPTHELLREGPPRETDSVGDRANDATQAAKLKLVDGYDWVRPSGGKTLELRPELTITTLALTPILEASEDTARWMECMSAKAASWVEQVNAAAASDPSFAACQLPLRHGDFVCWRTEPDGQGPVRELAVGRVAICLAEEVAVHRMTRVDERSSRTSARRGESVRLQSAALPTVEWVTRPRLYRAETMLTSRWEERKVGEVTVQMDPAWRPEDWHSTRLPPPSPTSLSPTLPALAPIGRPPAASRSPLELWEAAKTAAVVVKHSGAGLRTIIAAIKARDRVAPTATEDEQPQARARPGLPPLLQPLDQQAEDEPVTHNAYSDGSFKFVRTIPEATWGVVSADLSIDMVPRADQRKSGRLTGPLSVIGIDRAELAGLHTLLTEGRVASGGEGIDVGHVDRQATLDTAARLLTISDRHFLQLDHRDLWEGIQLFSHHLRGRFGLVKVTAHVDRLQPRRERTVHEWGNHYADECADEAMLGPAMDPIVARRLPSQRY
jgi:hypothetical protein